MVGVVSKSYDRNFIHEYCVIVAKANELQCICRQDGYCQAIHSSSIGTEIFEGNIGELLVGIEAVLQGTGSSIIRTRVQPAQKLHKYIPGIRLSPETRIPVSIFPVFQSKAPRDLYNITIHLEELKPQTPDNRSTDWMLKSQLFIDSEDSEHEYIVLDARTGVFFDASKGFIEELGYPEETLLRSRCEEIGMRELLLQATLNADRKCLFQAQLKPDDENQWFISETIQTEDRELIRVWKPDNFWLPQFPVNHATLSKPYREVWQTKPQSVLICDDNDLLLDACGSILEWAEIPYHSCLNGKDALQHLENHSFDYVLLDLNMPKLNGFDTARLIRNSKRTYNQIPIVAMTATPLEKSELSRQLKHFDSILQKPFDIEDVKTSIEEARKIRNLKIQSTQKEQLTNTPTTSIEKKGDFEPTSFMVQFSSRTDILENLRKEILNSLDANTKYLETQKPQLDPHLLTSFLKQLHSSAMSIGAYKLAEHSYIASKSMNPSDPASKSEYLTIVENCIEEAKSYFRVVDWERYIPPSETVEVGQNY